MNTVEVATHHGKTMQVRTEKIEKQHSVAFCRLHCVIQAGAGWLCMATVTTFVSISATGVAAERWALRRTCPLVANNVTISGSLQAEAPSGRKANHSPPGGVEMSSGGGDGERMSVMIEPDRGDVFLFPLFVWLQRQNCWELC